MGEGPGFEKRFADRQLLLGRLIADDPDFAEICENCRLAAAAELRWRDREGETSAKAAEYAVIAEELAREIEAALDEAEARIAAKRPSP